MPAKKKTPVKNQSKNNDKKTSKRLPQRLWVATHRHVTDLLARRPHRTFKKTRRRDYVRTLKLPGYWAFTNEVRRTIWKNKKLFLLIMAVYAVFTAALVGISSQDTYSQVADALRHTSGDLFKGNFGNIGETGLLLVTAATGAYSNSLNETQQVYAVLIAIIVWLVTVWALRAILSGKRPKLRDALYNSSAPLLSTILVCLVFLTQLLPVAIGVLAFGAGISAGILDGGVEAMLFWVGAALLAALSLYWTTSTFFALIIVTLPGMYPMKAITAAGDLVIGRRSRILFRIVWMLFIIALTWAVIMIPIMLIDAWLKGVWSFMASWPTVPLAFLLMGTVTVIWSASYVYLLYRKVVDDDADPA